MDFVDMDHSNLWLEHEEPRDFMVDKIKKSLETIYEGPQEWFDNRIRKA